MIVHLVLLMHMYHDVAHVRRLRSCRWQGYADLNGVMYQVLEDSRCDLHGTPFVHDSRGSNRIAT